MSDFQPRFYGVFVGYPDSAGNRARKVRAAFDSEWDANSWLQGMTDSARKSFVIEDLDGEEVVVRGNRERDGRLSHTYTVLASIDAAERAERKRQIEESGLARGDRVLALRKPRHQEPNSNWWGHVLEAGTPGQVLGLLEDPVQWPVCVFWVDATKTSFKAWFEFADVKKVETPPEDEA